MKEYRVCYIYNGEYTIEAGSNGWIPSKEIAQKILSNLQRKHLYQDRQLFCDEREISGSLQYGDCRILNGRKVLNRDWMYCDALMAGDLVENDVVDDFMNCLPPACYRSDCAQLGEAHSTEKDHTGKYRSTYLTFKRFDKETWEFCGYRNFKEDSRKSIGRDLRLQKYNQDELCL